MTSLYVSSPAIFFPLASGTRARRDALGDAGRVAARDFHGFFSSSKLATRYSQEYPRSDLFAGRYTILRSFLLRETLLLLPTVGSVYPFCFSTGRYQSYIFIVGVPHLSLAPSSLSLLLAPARLFPMCLGRTFSPTLSRASSAHLHHLRRADFISERPSSRKRDLRRRILRLEHLEVGMESRSRSFFFFYLKKITRIVLVAFIHFPIVSLSRDKLCSAIRSLKSITSHKHFLMQTLGEGEKNIIHFEKNVSFANKLYYPDEERENTRSTIPSY